MRPPAQLQWFITAEESVLKVQVFCFSFVTKEKKIFGLCKWKEYIAQSFEKKLCGLKHEERMPAQKQETYTLFWPLA